MISVAAIIPALLEVGKYIFKLSQKWGTKTFERGTDIREWNYPDSKDDRG